MPVEEEVDWDDPEQLLSAPASLFPAPAPAPTVPVASGRGHGGSGCGGSSSSSSAESEQRRPAIGTLAATDEGAEEEMEDTRSKKEKVIALVVEYRDKVMLMPCKWKVVWALVLILWAPLAYTVPSPLQKSRDRRIVFPGSYLAMTGLCPTTLKISRT